MHPAAAVVLVLAAGLLSQWLAWRIGLPAIVVLIAAGLALGPFTGLLAFGMPQAEVAELIGLGVAIILFEGGMDLKLAELRRVGHGVGRLTLAAPPLAWLLGSLAAWGIGGMSVPVSVVIGAILVVTGPTVILPLLRQARLNKESAALLKWEGIVNDPVGVLLAVLSFQYFTIGGEMRGAIAGMATAIATAAVLGGLGGWLVGRLYRRGGVPEHLKAPVLMAIVLIAYWASNQVPHEAGLLSVTLMGLVIGNMHLVEREVLQRFKEHLTVVLLSVLFIVIPAQLDAEALALLDIRALGFVLAVLFLVRPITIALATIAAPIRRQDRILLGWIAPRGIVAAATAGLFGPALVAAGHDDAARLLPVTFAIIIVTVLAHGLTIAPLARRLGLAAGRGNGLLIVGATPWTRVLGRRSSSPAWTSSSWTAPTIAADARMAGLDVYYGEILSEHAEHTLETQHLSHVLCATENDSTTPSSARPRPALRPAPDVPARHARIVG